MFAAFWKEQVRRCQSPKEKAFHAAYLILHMARPRLVHFRMDGFNRPDKVCLKELIKWKLEAVDLMLEDRVNPNLIWNHV